MKKLVAGLAAIVLVATSLTAKEPTGRSCIAGKITKTDGTTFTLKDYDGESYTMTYTAGVKVKDAKGSDIKIDQIKENTPVAVSFVQNGSTYNCSAVFETRTLKGKITNVSNKSFKIEDNGKSYSLNIQPGARILLSGNKNSSLDDLKDGDQATVWYNMDDRTETGYACEVRAKR